MNKRKKNSRQRGSKTHGWGSMKKHRGAGNRGGRGMAGTGKKAGQKTPSYWQERHYGKEGFKKKGVAKNISPVNLDQINKLLLNGKIKESVNLADLGFNKLLGKGNIGKIKITVEQASKKAVEKVKAAGGDVVLPKLSVEEPKKEE
ncbi:uL15m family ribosomal protein [Nanoarchaeota archaeon]